MDSLTGAAKDWATPTSAIQGGRYEYAKAGKGGMDISSQTQNWHTPHGMSGIDHTGKVGAGGEFAKQVEQWATPKAITGGANSKREERNAGGPDLQEMVNAWPTPDASADKYRLSGNSQQSKSLEPLSRAFMAYSPQTQAIQGGQESSPAGQTSRRRLNPAFGCFLMGIPCWWTNPGVTSCAQSAMASYRCRLQQHLSNLHAG